MVERLTDLELRRIFWEASSGEEFRKLIKEATEFLRELEQAEVKQNPAENEVFFRGPLLLNEEDIDAISASREAKRPQTAQQNPTPKPTTEILEEATHGDQDDYAESLTANAGSLPHSQKEMVPPNLAIQEQTVKTVNHPTYGSLIRDYMSVAIAAMLFPMAYYSTLLSEKEIN